MHTGEMMGDDGLDQDMAVDALEQIASICESYHGLVPKKDDGQKKPPVEVKETTVSVAPEGEAEEEVVEDVVPPAEEAKGGEPPPISVISYGGGAKHGGSALPEELPKKRGPGRPRKSAY